RNGGWRHQRAAIDDPTRKEGRKLRLRPTNDLNGGTVDEHLGLRRGPEHLVDDVVGPVRGISDTIAVEIEGGIVAPVVSAPILRPIEITGADVFHLIAIADERIAHNGVAFGSGREVDADLTSLEPVVLKRVLVGIIDEHTFLRSVTHAAA